MAPISLRTKRCSTAFFLVMWLRWSHSYGTFSSGEHSWPNGHAGRPPRVAAVFECWKAGGVDLQQGIR